MKCSAAVGLRPVWSGKVMKCTSPFSARARPRGFLNVLTLMRGKITILQQQAHAAATKVGVKNLTLHDLPDNRLDTVPLLDVVKIVESLVERLEPEVIYTHHAGDLNVDHGVIHRAVLTATRPMAGQPVRDIYAFEVASSTEWAFQRIEPAFRPNVFVDITRTIEVKIAAMECYETEARKFPHPRSPEALRALATRWGSVVGCAAAEAFELVRSVRPVRPYLD